ncbi:MAG: RNA polymerase sigma factor [Proteobacteria bacterium]|nr:RNA polymerase sigma factor [Pseudomonadota bacterium]
MSLDLHEFSDSELVALSLAGRDHAFAELVRRHSDSLYRLALASLGNREDTLEVVQDIFVAAHGALRRFDDTKPLRPWLAAIGLNRCRDIARRRRVRHFLTFAKPLDSTNDNLPFDEPGADISAADRQELQRTFTAIAALPTALREPLILHTIENLTQAETAKLLKISEKAVETRLRRARQQLRAALGVLR